ncbi:MAG: DnaB-like helicase N-terminal domain-containing protein, partial [bacterium]
MTTTSYQKFKTPVKSPLRIPPQNIESEKALLGSIMLRPGSMHDITDIIKSDSFYAEKHRIIYSGMMDLFTKSNPIDLLSLSARLSEKNQLEQIGGSAYLTELINIVPSSANLIHYAEIVQKKQMLRNLIEASDFISSLGYGEAEELEEILDKAEKRIFEVTNFSGVHKFT